MRELKCTSCGGGEFDSVKREGQKTTLECAYCKTIFYDQDIVEERPRPQSNYYNNFLASSISLPMTATSTYVGGDVSTWHKALTNDEIMALGESNYSPDEYKYDGRSIKERLRGLFA